MFGSRIWVWNKKFFKNERIVCTYSFFLMQYITNGGYLNEYKIWMLYLVYVIRAHLCADIP